MSPHSIDANEQLPSLVNGTGGSPQLNRKGIANGQPTGYSLQPAPAEEIHDLVCVGFGPASLAVAVAVYDALEAGTLTQQPSVLFLEKQDRFAWHAGMLLPGAKMQISFIKDLASLRDPRSHFTFLNYLHQNDRLVEFINLGTFLPARVEYEDYLGWSARHFDQVVRYRNEVVSVAPIPDTDGPQKTFSVTSRNVETGIVTTFYSRNVLLALGGQPSIPAVFPAKSPLVIHSSQYAHNMPRILKDKTASYSVAVVGAGQSAAEIFSNVQHLYPNSKTYLVMKSDFLKPSDDSPFVNSIFNPSFIDYLYPKPTAHRQSLLADARATNYGVVRLELIERLYENMYEQMRELGKDEAKWPHRILAGRRVVSAKTDSTSGRLLLRIGAQPLGEEVQDGSLLEEETLDVDLVVAATGYKRTAHVDMLRGVWHMLPEDDACGVEAKEVKGRWLVRTVEKEGMSTRKMEVGRDYAVKFAPGTIAPGSGIWLLGCNEGTHGLSDTLLSVLGPRSGEVVQSIFGEDRASKMK